MISNHRDLSSSSVSLSFKNAPVVVFFFEA